MSGWKCICSALHHTATGRRPRLSLLPVTFSGRVPSLVQSPLTPALQPPSSPALHTSSARRGGSHTHHAPRPRLPAGVPLLGCPPISPPHSVRWEWHRRHSSSVPFSRNSPAPPAELHTHSLTHSLQWHDLLTPLTPCSTMNFLKAVCLSISSTGRVLDTQQVVNKTRDGLDWNTVPGTERGRNTVGRVRRPQLQLQLCWFLLQEPPARVLDCLT